MVDSFDQLNEEEKQKFFGMVRECVNSKIRQSSETDFQKDVINRAKDELGVPPKKFRKVLKLAYNNSHEEERKEIEEIAEIVEEMNQQ